MARPKIYKDAESKRQAQRDNSKRYIEKNLIKIEARLPKEYGPKLEYIAQRMNTSKAQVLKMCIDRLYLEMQENE